jgi:hypothetical protein
MPAGKHTFYAIYASFFLISFLDIAYRLIKDEIAVSAIL